MALSLYSQVVVDENTLSGIAGTYDVPAGLRLVVRDMAVLTSTDSSTGGVVIQSTASLAHLWYQGTPAGETTYLHWQGRQIIEEGDGLTFNVYGNVGTSLRICGYLLTV